jgi:hypothetical protein
MLSLPERMSRSTGREGSMSLNAPSAFLQILARGYSESSPTYRISRMEIWRRKRSHVVWCAGHLLDERNQIIVSSQSIEKHAGSALEHQRCLF